MKKGFQTQKAQMTCETVFFTAMDPAFTVERLQKREEKWGLWQNSRFVAKFFDEICTF